MTDDDKKTSEVEETNENTELETQLSELQAKADEYLDICSANALVLPITNAVSTRKTPRWLNGFW